MPLPFDSLGAEIKDVALAIDAALTSDIEV